jgi:hypothetical protein
MLGSFERWFKQCDESILNDAAATTSGNISLGKTPREMCLFAARETRWNQTMNPAIKLRQ